MDENFENWEQVAPLPDVDKELKQIQRNLRKRNWRIVLTCLALAAAIVIGIVNFALPAWEAQYWDPNTQTYAQYSNDLTVTMAAYAELFSPTQIINHVSSTRTGFASHSLSIQQWRMEDHGDISYLSAYLDKGELIFPTGTWKMCSANIFERACYPEYDMGESFDQNIREDLSQLPDYIQVEAAVSFPEDKSMVQIMELSKALQDCSIEWVAIRTCSMGEQMYPLCGMKPFAGGICWEDVNESYPYFDIKRSCDNPEVLEKHFKTLLQFSLDQQKAGIGIAAQNYHGTTYYERALAYVEENGVCSYGAYIVAPASTLLELMDSGIASQIWPQDAWIDF